MKTETPHRKTAIIVDDERLAAKGLKLLLADFPQVDVLGSAATIDAAVALIEAHDPDLIFLDIQLQGETGFDLFERTAVSARVIFVTAFDAYAVRAFEVNALDYLLKPVSRERFKLAMARCCGNLGEHEEIREQLGYGDMVALNVGGVMRFVKLHQVVSITAEGDYTRVCIDGGENVLVLKSMKAWEAILPDDHFARVHRSAILNMACVHKIERTTSNRFLAHLSDHTTTIPMSQRYSARLRKKFNHKVGKLFAMRN